MTDTHTGRISNNRSSSSGPNPATNLPGKSSKIQKSSVKWVFRADTEDDRLAQSPIPDYNVNYEDTLDHEDQNGNLVSETTSVMSSPKPSSFSSLPSLDYAQELSPDGETNLTMIAYQSSPIRICAYTAASCMTLGAGFLFGRWFPKWKLRLTSTICSLDRGQVILIENSWGEEDAIFIKEIPWNGPLSDAFPATAPPAPSSSPFALISPLSAFTNGGSGAGPLSTAYTESLRIFDYRHWRFVYNPVFGQYECIANWTDPAWSSSDHVLRGLCGDAFVKRRQLLFGRNVVDIEEPSWIKLLFDEVLHPFFVFQIFSIILWSYDNYYIYAACILIISAVSVFTALVETKRSIKRMREMSRVSVNVRIWRNGHWLNARSEDLVPGDVFQIPSSGMSVFPCDALLLKGDCIVNEALLTGESVPVAKFPTSSTSPTSSLGQLVAMLSDGVDPTRDAALAKSYMFAGTKIIRVRILGRDDDEPCGALGFAVRTGFSSTRGGLVRAMLYPKPHRKFKFYEDAFKFIAFLFGIACVGFLFSLYHFIQMNVSWDVIVVRALDLVTIVVPPALPATMTIGTSFALARLRRYGIYCIAPSRINIGGKLEVMCFDKTGTLTREGLEILGLLHVKRGIEEGVRFDKTWETVEHAVMDSVTSVDDHVDGVTPDFPYPPLVCVAALCHSIKMIDGILSGDPLDLQMFQYTGFRLEEVGSSSPSSPRMSTSDGIPVTATIRPPLSVSSLVVQSAAGTGQDLSELYSTEFGVLRLFEFDSALRRAAIVVERLRYRSQRLRDVEAKDYEVFVKGAPEVMRNICSTDSLPPDYDLKLANHARCGHRVIACAWRKFEKNASGLHVATCKREEVERDLIFVGFALFENRPKEGTTSVMKSLYASHLRTVMCTGDNAGTAIAVAREVELIPPHCSVFVSCLVQGDLTVNTHVAWELVSGGDDVRLPHGCQLELDPITFKLRITNPANAPRWYNHYPHQPTSPMTMSRSTSASSWQSSFRINSHRGSMDGLLGHTGHNATASPHQKFMYSLAVTGDVFQWMLEFASKERMDRLLVKCQIFARMSPDQKQIMVERLQDLGYCTGFIGDGANDCGALRAADVGISLSEAEASVAAQLTSKSPDLACVLQVVKEGRAALVTSFGLFKFMALYSLVQFSSVCLMYTFSANLGDVQYMYIDLVLILPVAVFMGRSGPAKTISPRRPTASLTSKKVLTSLVGQIFLQVLAQVYIFVWVRRQPWYLPPRYFMGDAMNVIACHENTVVFLVSSFQYLAMATVFTRGPPFREPIWRNVPLMLLLSLLLGLNSLLVLHPTGILAQWLQLVDVPFQGRIHIFEVAMMGWLLSWVGETYGFPFIAKWIANCVDRLMALRDPELRKCGRRLLKVEKWRRRGKMYKIINHALEEVDTDSM
ncbi:hypothetical protein SeMB42_g01692 [Synchytrium endobioticum]|uniref:Cation-transporting ATPase n=1 Tax=Synchytrium endobioticum TaxID=286115 RepID=A0A507DKU9_9FUNG|nr:hypothetical protein SeLEV6574_g03760 [Synchytrium endobioticum]TPX52051.1 hypothetical protein SeMB42_g01692 [Synchytrium endobioticum]